PTLTPARVSAAAADARIVRLLPGRMASSLLGGAPGAILAIEVRDSASGRLVYAKQNTTGLRGASTNKLFTAAVAFETMGPSHRLVTKARLGTVSGTTAALSLVGGGDPLLTSAQLDALAARTVTALRARGLKQVSVSIDDTLFAPPTPAVGWPSSYGLDVVRPVRPLVRDGRMLTDVATDAGKYFAARVAVHGGSQVSATYTGRAHFTSSRPTLASTSGHTVEQAVRQMLQISDNDIAEMLFRLSAHADRMPATWSGGIQTVRNQMKKLGVPLANVVFRDGSGASREDRLTALSLTVLLDIVVNKIAHPELSSIYYGRAMPVAGRTGSLSGRYLSAPSSCAAGLTVAKTGALHDVLSLAGITVGADGARRSFTILLENPPTDRYGGRPVRVAIDGLVATIAGCW
ncbi:MAG: D-alanyl-D-alanine carboxypeptidase, partial [Actinomycetes bacterium]